MACKTEHSSRPDRTTLPEPITGQGAASAPRASPEASAPARKRLRSANSYGKLDRDGSIHRSWMKSHGLAGDVFDGRLGVPLEPEDFDRPGRDMPLLHADAVTISGQPLRAQIEGAGVFNDEVIRTSQAPVKHDSGIWVLRGKRHHRARRGHAKLYIDHVLQAGRGADFDFPVGASGADLTRESP